MNPPAIIKGSPADILITATRALRKWRKVRTAFDDTDDEGTDADAVRKTQLRGELDAAARELVAADEAMERFEIENVGKPVVLRQIATEKGPKQ